MNHKDFTTAARAHQLDIFGALHDADETILLLGPYEPGFWRTFQSSTHYQDGQADPLDRWSKSIISGLADQWRGRAIFPSDGPPFPPFYDWALQSGRSRASPLVFLVHDTAGLWASFRGAIRVPERLELPSAPLSPCVTCDAPCETACPVEALSPDNYDVERCKAHLNTEDRANCMDQGCAARRVCPISQTYGRQAAQSAFHMKAFNP